MGEINASLVVRRSYLGTETRTSLEIIRSEAGIITILATY
jgi:hypothetical protein